VTPCPTRDAPAAVGHEILHRCYLPHRGRAEGEIAAAVGHGLRAIPISSHSYTPELED
jgi:hypothetical protein